MHGIAAAADAVRRTRYPLPDDNPALIEERALIARTTGVLEDARKRRDAAQEGLFGRLYGAEP